jgi:glycerol-3-phosphate acyltransferase PlsY
MIIFQYLVVLLLAYLIGSIPMGLLVVKIKSGQDIRKIQSGRTGGTNVMRAAGLWAGIATAVFDILKGASGVWLARLLVPDTPWLEVLAPIMVIVGHNYSIFLIDRDENGRIHLHGGAGGSPSVGGAMGIWLPSIFILFPIGALILFGIGYASVATMAMPLIMAIIFAIRAGIGAPGAEWIYVAYGLLAEILLMWSLRPNIKRLFNGTERLIGWRAKRRQAKSQELEQSSETADNLKSTSDSPPE